MEPGFCSHLSLLYMWHLRYLFSLLSLARGLQDSHIQPFYICPHFYLLINQGTLQLHVLGALSVSDGVASCP